MAIQFNKVTWYSAALAVVLFVGVFWLALWMGTVIGSLTARVPVVVAPIISTQAGEQNASGGKITSADFTCDGGKTIHAVFFDQKAELSLSDGRNMLLLQGISGSGARYANTDESFVFWNKGNTAFVQEGKNETYQNCAVNVAK